jgi:hypothetical protein
MAGPRSEGVRIHRSGGAATARMFTSEDFVVAARTPSPGRLFTKSVFCKKCYPASGRIPGISDGDGGHSGRRACHRPQDRQALASTRRPR